ncbi:MAG TPA: DUF1801 domain-containing protein [Opitutaceae bacterium]|nr:DUF1801 domain-containing protein [Opitutaceae bacterium]
MKAAASIKTPAQYLASLPAERRVALQTIHDAIVSAAPELKPFIVYGMLGYGPYHYKYASGREGDGAVVALASQKNYISLYVCAGDKDGYLAEKNRDQLGKVSVGKSCIRFKKLEDLNLETALQLVRKASKLAAKPGGFQL